MHTHSLTQPHTHCCTHGRVESGRGGGRGCERAMLLQCVQFKRTALMWAAIKGHPEIIKMLLQADADPNIKNKVSGKGGRCMAWLHAWLASPMAAAPAVLQDGETALELVNRFKEKDPSGECARMLGGEQCQPLSTQPAHGWRHGCLIIQPMHASVI